MMIKKWVVKACLQKVISFFPNPEKINLLFQRYITKGVFLNDEYFGYKIQHAIDHIEYFKIYGNVSEDKIILELGTGWYPIVPITMFLTKMGSVISLDIQSWLTKEGELTTINKFIEWRNKGKLEEIDSFIDPERWDLLVQIVEKNATITFQDINDTIGLTPLLKDARKTELPGKSVDFICSNNTFEHIYPDVLSDILIEFKRIIKPGGIMSHFIDLSDHFAHSDKSINIYNFLRFSNRLWALLDNKIQPQNRLRFIDYLELYKSINIPVTDQDTREGHLDHLKSIKIHSEFKEYSFSELAISHGYIVSKL